MGSPQQAVTRQLKSPTFLTQELINIFSLQGNKVEFIWKSRNFKQASYQFSKQHKEKLLKN